LEIYKFWTGALKDANSTRWYWEPTGEDITYFYWAYRQPSLENNSGKACIDFITHYDVAGWSDEECNVPYAMSIFCEEKSVAA